MPDLGTTTITTVKMPLQTAIGLTTRCFLWQCPMCSEINELSIADHPAVEPAQLVPGIPSVFRRPVFHAGSLLHCTTGCIWTAHSLLPYDQTVDEYQIETSLVDEYQIETSLQECAMPDLRPLITLEMLNTLYLAEQGNLPDAEMVKLLEEIEHNAGQVGTTLHHVARKLFHLGRQRFMTEHGSYCRAIWEELYDEVKDRPVAEQPMWHRIESAAVVLDHLAASLGAGNVSGGESCCEEVCPCWDDWQAARDDGGTV